MKMMLLCALGSVAAMAIFPSAPAQVQDWRGDSHHNRGFVGRVDPCKNPASGERCRRRSNEGLITDWYGADWAYANNQGWESDSYNDWWHDQPWRAYPHWTMHNEGCARQWYAGDTLRC